MSAALGRYDRDGNPLVRPEVQLEQPVPEKESPPPPGGNLAVLAAARPRYYSRVLATSTVSRIT